MCSEDGKEIEVILVVVSGFLGECLFGIRGVLWWDGGGRVIFF